MNRKIFRTTGGLKLKHKAGSVACAYSIIFISLQKDTCHSVSKQAQCREQRFSADRLLYAPEA